MTGKAEGEGAWRPAARIMSGGTVVEWEPGGALNLTPYWLHAASGLPVGI